MSKIITPFNLPEDDPPKISTEEQEIIEQAELFGRKALEKLKQLGYEWDGEKWYLEGENSD